MFYSESKKATLLKDIERRLDGLIDTNFKMIALELKGHDPYMYHKAFTGGIQEFIEAYTFYQFIKNESIGDWKSFNNLFQYKDDENGEFSLLFTQLDFILGKYYIII